jgi:hypothetical protein
MAERGAWRRYQQRINGLSKKQLENDHDEPAAWAELQTALSLIKERRAQLNKSRPAARKRGL